MHLALLAMIEIVASKNRNVPIAGLVLLFGLADAADYAGAAGAISADIGWRSAIALVVIMISVIGGRIIPSFTRNWMAKRGIKHGLPTQPQALDLLVIASTALALLLWLGFPENRLAGFALILASAAQLLVRVSVASAPVGNLSFSAPGSTRTRLTASSWTAGWCPISMTEATALSTVRSLVRSSPAVAA
jgi:uncharacterized protein involved in response to NO